MKAKRPDRFFFILTFVLALTGFIVFSSAALGLLGRDGATFTVVAGKQLFILLVSLALCVIVAGIPYLKWQKVAPYLLGLAVVLTLLVFVDGIGMAAGGAQRWIKIPVINFSFQPGELLKLATVMAWAWWLAGIKDKVKTFKWGFLPLVGLCGVLGVILLAQPNTSTLGIIGVSVTAMFLVAGGKWRHLLLLALMAAIVLGGVVLTRDYVRSRVVTFFNPSHDLQGASYQLNQAHIAIGSGGLFGRGFGQSVQKFNNLPEPIGDSIFAVGAEEFGLIGTTTFLLLLLVFSLWGLKIAGRVHDPFGRLLALGIVILIASQSLINIGAMIGLLPLTGVPLVFVSQGGSALMLALIEAGIVLNISRYTSTT
ncbi:MAG: cell division protein FtsW [Candidatus Pacebacteria bacterium]|nr:cell division protein FtsW [Candidatus Paceibacterota bacterium]